MNDVNTMIYTCAKAVESRNLEINRKSKENLTKNKIPKQKIYIEKEIETMRGEMSILEIE